MRSVARLALVAVLALLLVPVTAAAAPSAAPVSPPSDVSGLVDIGGRRLYLECRGQGSPTVVLEAGYGNPGAIWNDTVPDLPSPAVLPGVASFTRVCTYDRPDTFLGSPQDDFGRSR